MHRAQCYLQNAEELGYKVSYGKHEMDENLKNVIDKYAMPTTMKGMQFFLGAALFFKSNLDYFSDKSANLHRKVLKGIEALRL